MKKLGTLVKETQRRKEYLPYPECILYEPLSLTEGRCAFDKSVVNIQLCDNPKNCDRHAKYMGGRD